MAEPRVPMRAARIAAARALARAHPERGMGMSEMDAMTALAAAAPYLIEDFLNWQATSRVTVETDVAQAALIRMAMATAWDEGRRSVHTHTSACGEGCNPGNPYREEV